MKKLAIKWAQFRASHSTSMRTGMYAFGGLTLFGIGLKTYLESSDPRDLILAAGGLVITLRTFELYGFTEWLNEIRKKDSEPS